MFDDGKRLWGPIDLSLFASVGAITHTAAPHKNTSAAAACDDVVTGTSTAIGTRTDTTEPLP
jgi:hypothetical protein